MQTECSADLFGFALSVWGGTIALGDALGRVHVFEAEDFLSAEGSATD